MSNNPAAILPSKARELSCFQQTGFCKAFNCMAWRWVDPEWIKETGIGNQPIYTKEYGPRPEKDMLADGYEWHSRTIGNAGYYRKLNKDRRGTCGACDRRV